MQAAAIVTQGLDGIQAGRFAGRVESKKNPHRRGKGKRHEQGAIGDDDIPLGEIGHHLRPDSSQPDPDQPPHQAQHNGFGQKLEEDITGTGPHSHPDADLRVRSVTETSMIFMIPMPPRSGRPGRWSPTAGT